MSKNNFHNSILILTSLSLFFGLAVASPVVLAQRSGSDLELSSEQYFLTNFDNALNVFVEDLRTLKNRRKYKFASRRKYKNTEEIKVGSVRTFCSDNVVDASSSYVASWVSKELETLKTNLDFTAGKTFSTLPKFIGMPVDSRGNPLCKELNLEFSIDKNELTIEVKFTQNSGQNALVTAENLNAGFSNKSLNATNDSSKKFFQNTKAKAENQYVSVTTRLARGSLDALVRSKR
jgi:hypothetical protein